MWKLEILIRFGPPGGGGSGIRLYFIGAAAEMFSLTHFLMDYSNKDWQHVEHALLTKTG